MVGNIGNHLVVMNLILRPHENLNDPTWSVIWSIVLLLIGVAYYIYTIMKSAYEELDEQFVETKVEESSTIHTGGTVSDNVCNSGESD